jgi:hypothetical protein
LLVKVGAGLITQASADAQLKTFQCDDPTAIEPLEAHRLVTEYIISFLDQISDTLDHDRGENMSEHLLDPKWAAKHEPGVSLFLTEEGGPQTAVKNQGETPTFQYYWFPPTASHKPR